MSDMDRESEKPSEKPADENAQEREEAIRRRAYEISQEPGAGTAEENWERAERELSAGT